MRKGQAGKIIIVIIIIVAIVFFLWPYIAQYLGATPITPGIEYKNDVITIEEYSISNLNPYVGRPVTISFYVQNNGDKKTENVRVKFFSIEPFSDSSIACWLPPGESGSECNFPSIESTDRRYVSLTMNAPKDITDDTPITIGFEVSYYVTGYRTAIIPIVDNKLKTKPDAKYMQSAHSYGPVHVDLKPKIERITVENGKEIKETWAIQGEQFELEMNFKHVGTLKDVSLPIKIDNIKFDPDPPYGLNPVSNLCKLSEGAEVPGDKSSLSCYLEPLELEVGESERLGIASVTFEYPYKFTRTETFTVRPEPT